jgi:predicted N-acetyltransferase YhbS
LGVDLSFQDVQSELRDLPGKYKSPQGRVVLALRDGQVLGCVALRPFNGRIAEMKRLYVRPAGRGQQLGKRLAERVCQIAREIGYSRIRLDTLPDMMAAQQLYTALGFKPISAYVFNPVAGTQFMELDLAHRLFDDAPKQPDQIVDGIPKHCYPNQRCASTLRLPNCQPSMELKIGPATL